MRASTALDLAGEAVQDAERWQPSGGRTVTGRLRLVAVVASGLIASLLPTGTALAQEANQVTGLAVEQADGFATLSWNSVAGATDYQIERTPVGADDVPTGPPAIVGVWRPNRTVTPDSPTFADAGFNPSDRFQWRVRARSGTTEHPFSAPVFDTTLPQWETRPCRARTCARSGS